jgi:hypothetical protein
MQRTDLRVSWLHVPEEAVQRDVKEFNAHVHAWSRVQSFPCRCTQASPAAACSAATMLKIEAKISQFNSDFAENSGLHMTPQELEGVKVCRVLFCFCARCHFLNRSCFHPACCCSRAQTR